MSAVNDDRGPSRGLLRQTFRQLHRVVANVVDPESIVEELIASHVIKVTDWETLQSLNSRVERCSKLLTLIDGSSSAAAAAAATSGGGGGDGVDDDDDDDEVFCKVRLAMKRVSSYGWIVDEVDELYDKLKGPRLIGARTMLAESEMMKTLAKIESNHAKILEFERRRYERRIRKLAQQLDEEKQKMNNFSEKNNGERSADEDVGWASVRDAQYRVAVMADSEQDQQLSPFYSFGCGKPICSMTSLDNELFIARTDLSDVEVYDVYTFNRLRTQSVRGLGIAADMAACSRRRCVYVADQLHGVVHRIMTRRPAAEKDGTELQQWPVGDKPAGLSVNSSTNVLVACPEMYRIREFSSKGRPVRSIQLSKDFVNVTHAVQLTTDQLVVGHGTSTDLVCRICVVDADGRILRSYGGRRGSGRGQLDSPIRVAVCGFVFVLDFGNRRVLRLGPSFRGAREVISTSSGLNWPLRMWLDDELGRVYVADNSSDKVRYIGGQVKVFAIADEL